jgi:hypothetical protein
MLKIDYDYDYVIDWKSIAFSIKLKIWNDFYKISKELGVN